MPEINAHLTKALIDGHVSDDGKYGLIGLRRERADSMGSEDLWIGVPVALLPQLAAAAMAAIPQPGQGPTGQQTAVFETEKLEVGTGGEGQLVLTTTFPQGPSLSTRIDEGQAQALLQQLQLVINRPDMQSPPGRKPN